MNQAFRHGHSRTTLCSGRLASEGSVTGHAEPVMLREVVEFLCRLGRSSGS